MVGTGHTNCYSCVFESICSRLNQNEAKYFRPYKPPRKSFADRVLSGGEKWFFFGMNWNHVFQLLSVHRANILLQHFLTQHWLHSPACFSWFQQFHVIVVAVHSVVKQVSKERKRWASLRECFELFGLFIGEWNYLKTAPGFLSSHIAARAFRPFAPFFVEVP